MNTTKPEIETCARGAHEVIRAYAFNLGDYTHLSWDLMTPEQKEPAVLCAIGILEQDHTPAQSHDAWVALRLAQGWQPSRMKDVEAKLHPCLMPYEHLPTEHRVKNELFHTVVKAIARALLHIPQ